MADSQYKGETELHLAVLLPEKWSGCDTQYESRVAGAWEVHEYSGG